MRSSNRFLNYFVAATAALVGIYADGSDTFAIGPPAHLWGVGAGNGLRIQRIGEETGALSNEFNFVGSGIRHSARDLAGNADFYGTSIWAVTTVTFGGSGDELVRIDPWARSFVSRTPITSASRIQTLAIDPTDGAFFGTSELGLHRVDPVTGQTTLVGGTPIDDNAALGFDLAGNLYGVFAGGELTFVDKATGARQFIADVPVRLEDIAMRPSDGVMFGVGLGADGLYYLYQLDLSDGSVEYVGPSIFRPSGLAFVAVPEPGALRHCLAAITVLSSLRYFRMRDRSTRATSAEARTPSASPSRSSVSSVGDIRSFSSRLMSGEACQRSSATVT